MTQIRLSFILAVTVILSLLAMPAPPASAAVILAGFEGKAEPPSTVHLAWRTDAEEGNSGFYVWRQTEEQGDPAVVGFVPSAAPPSGLGAAYAYTDTVPAPGLYTYWLVSEDEASGTQQTHDPIQIAVNGPTAVVLASLAAGSGLTCRRVNQGNGCECYIRSRNGTGLGWRSRPMLWCALAGV